VNARALPIFSTLRLYFKSKVIHDLRWMLVHPPADSDQNEPEGIQD